MTTYYPPKINTEFVFYAGLVASANRPDFKISPTIAAGDFQVSTDGGSLTNLDTAPAESPASSGIIKFTVSADEMNGANTTIVGIDAAGAEWDDIIINIQTATNQLDDVAALVTTVDGVVDNILNDTDVIDDATSGLVKIAQDVAAVLADTGTSGVVLKAAGLNADAVDEILDEVIEGSTTLRQAIAVILAAVAGQSSGGGTTSIKFRDVADSKDRISATVDSDGNRTAITIDGS